MAFLAYGYFTGGSAGACTITNIEGREDAFIVNGELDYGIVVTANLSNDGRAADYKVTATVEMAGGDISREVVVRLEDNGKRTVDVQFPEPNIGDVTQRVRARCERA